MKTLDQDQDQDQDHPSDPHILGTYGDFTDSLLLFRSKNILAKTMPEARMTKSFINLVFKLDQHLIPSCKQFEICDRIDSFYYIAMAGM